MIDRIIEFSIKNKLIIGLFILGLVGWGSYSLTQIPLDAVPDITNNQIQVITRAPDLATQEVEQFITYPLEVSMSFIPDVTEIRSISRFGLSVITIVFEDQVDPYLARQLVSEQIRVAEKNIPEGFGTPELAPLATGLSEIYQYTLHTTNGYDTTYTATELRTIQDWIVKRQLAGVPGVAEVSSFGGFLKQYEVAINPEKLRSHHLTLSDIYTAVAENSDNTGGSYIEKTNTVYFIRAAGMVQSLDDINQIVVKNIEGIPITIKDVATVQYGHAPRFGALTRNGKGEVVGGLVLMLKGENSHAVTLAVKERIKEIQKSMPEGVVIEPFLDRSKLIERTIKTVTTNLVEGGLIVIFILVLLLGNFRAGLIVASVIPLSMLFALGMMNVFGVSANLMSLGAIDFGLIVDGSVIIVEAIVHRLYTNFNGQKLSLTKMDEEVGLASKKIRKSAAFGEIIILIVYLPILALTGIEGKMFQPMAQTVSFAILGALILSLTYVPMMSALFLKRRIEVKTTISDRIMAFLHKLYDPVIHLALRVKVLVIIVAVGAFLTSLFLFSRMGSEFIPTLEEGDIASHQILPTGTSLSHMVEVSTKIQKALMERFPEVEEVVNKIGSSEIPTDPMPIEVADIIIVLKDKSEWVSASTLEEMYEKMEQTIYTIPGVATEFTQPIQMRFNELMSGVRQDIAVKIYGEDLNILAEKAKEANQLISSVEGVGGSVVEQTTGLPQIKVDYKREKIAQYGLTIAEVNRAVNIAFAGGNAGLVFEGEKRFELVVRFKNEFRRDIENISNMYIKIPSGGQVPLKEVATVKFEESPAQISRDNAKRRVVIGVNTRNRDTEGVVVDIQNLLSNRLDLPPGYYITYGGQFENLIEARNRLSVAVPIALGLILILLFFTFHSMPQALLIFTAVPMSAIGGVLALWIRDMPFSISAGVGFIALFGVAVLNGIVLIGELNRLKQEGITDISDRIFKGTHRRLRPVILTAAVASLGFLPMALSTSAGAEVQRPLATVVIGGLITATLLTLVVIPVLYYYLERGWNKRGKSKVITGILMLLGMCFSMNSLMAQEETTSQQLTLQKAIKIALENNPVSRQANLQVERQEALQKSAFDFGNTALYFQQEETNGSNFPGVQTLGIQQSFDFPTTYIRKSQFQKTLVDISRKDREISLNDLVAEVSHAYNNWLLAKSRLKLMQELDSIYHNFESAAKLRFETGETGRLEFLTATTQYRQVSIALQQAEMDNSAAVNNLKTWLNIDTNIEPETSELYRFQGYTPPDTGKIEENPGIALFKENIRSADLAHKVQRSKYLPDINIGYGDQTVGGTEGFYLYRAGVSFPLLFFAQKGRTQAARLNKTIAEEELEKQKLQLERRWKMIWYQWQKANASLSYFEDEGLVLAEEQVRTALMGYEAGETDYVQLTQNLAQAVGIQENYLRSLYEYNMAAIELSRLAGKIIVE